MYWNVGEYLSKESYSKRELERQINSGYYERYILSKGKILPEPVKDLKEKPFLDSYVIEFLNLPQNFKESDLRKGLIQNMKKFIMRIWILCSNLLCGKEERLTVI